MEDKLLPIGTVVLLKGATKKVMINGYYSKTDKNNKIYTYNGCIFPEGFMNNVFCLFDKSDIKKVLYLGYESEELDKYIAKMPVRKQHSYVVNSAKAITDAGGLK